MLQVTRKFPAGQGTPGGTRTRTRALLRRLPLPLGYGGAAAADLSSTGQAYGPPAQHDEADHEDHDEPVPLLARRVAFIVIFTVGLTLAVRASPR